MSEIQKPATVLHAEFVSNLMDIVNGSGLPPFILAPILKDVYRDVSALAQRQLDEDLKNFKDSLQSAAHSADD